MDHPNWVRGRANCNLSKVFADLCEIVKRDVQEFNALPANDRRDRLFHWDSIHREEDGGNYPTLRVEDEAGNGVSFELSPAAITVATATKRFYIKPEWHFERRSCDFRVNDQERFLLLWEVSQQGLDRLFFG